ncbi:MAG: alpha/beta hydrolase [Sphingomonas sp.]|uniref:Pimeloyl-ACP methyl ester carboxylesterase n=1 Tax=Stakelama pacifica TaxID=517720 RepID=A0A4V3BSC6_9SPHN|nr:alpha/beta hydrolase [Sphingomonas sp.]TDN78988.1 pimeloyl-ACP methyl ester carboxylesterase [Stakelama pacifica]GGO98936.1 putative hydrolase, alpha/beta fold family protein [Stakelama pacifica]
MHRHSSKHHGLTFSYLDEEAPGPPVLALHGHWMNALDFEGLAAALAQKWRVIALDQRSFGETDASRDHQIDAYVSDVAAMLDHIGITSAVPMIGHSFGGVVAYHMAARMPERVSRTVIVDIGTSLDEEGEFTRSWAGVFPLKEKLEERIGARLSPYLQNLIHRVEDGWRLNFEIEEYLLSVEALNGNHEHTWLSSHCPALVVKGADSPLSDRKELKAMALERPETSYIEIAGGHSVHIDAPDAFAAAVEEFLDRET